MYGAYNFCAVIVLLNMLIAMMSRSFDSIQVYLYKNFLCPLCCAVDGRRPCASSHCISCFGHIRARSQFEPGSNVSKTRLQKGPNRFTKLAGPHLVFWTRHKSRSQKRCCPAWYTEFLEENSALPSWLHGQIHHHLTVQNIPCHMDS